jgi:hypothetical protein
MKRSAIDRATRIVDRLGIVLVYPIDNKPEPRSLWSELHPKVTMEWAWDEGADPRVAELWHLRERLARSHDVAYAKWFRGRATFFSLSVFHALLGQFARAGDVFAGLPREARDILELLRERSPLSTKELRALADLRGKEHEAVFNHAMKALWSRLLVVGTGEVPDGAFPSLAVGATELLFEDTWNARREVPVKANKQLDEALTQSPAFARELRRALDDVTAGRVGAPRQAASAAARASLRGELDAPVKRPPRTRVRTVRGAVTADEPPFTEPSAAEVFKEDR